MTDLATERTTAATIAAWREAAARSQRRRPLPALSNGWSVSDGTPGDVVVAFDRLHLRPGFELRAYRMQWGRDGESRVFALPAGAELPEPSGDEPAPPPQALADPMDAIEGDGSALSYLQASILARELDDFEAFGHGERWARCTVVDDPGDVAGLDVGDPEPFARVIGERAEASYLVRDPLGRQRLVRVHDTFAGRRCRPHREERELLTTPGGYVP
jgi:hypothetical protein